MNSNTVFLPTPKCLRNFFFFAIDAGCDLKGRLLS